MNEQLIEPLLSRYATFNDFEVDEELGDSQGFKTFQLHYYRDEGLHTLEAFGEGTFNIGRLRVERKYFPSGCTAEEKAKGADAKFTYYTKVVDEGRESKPVG